MPRQEPATDAGASAVRPAGGLVQDVSASLQKVWKTREFYLTITKLRASGTFKMTLWAARAQARLRHHEYLQRMRHLFSLDNPDMDPAERERWSLKLLGSSGR